MTLPMLLACGPLLWASVADIRTRTIPTGSLYLLFACGIAAALCATVSFALLGLVVVGGLTLICAVCLDGGNAIGGGDVWLAAAVGMLLGAFTGLLTVALAMVLMLLAAVLKKAKAMPFAPFLSAAYILLLILQRS